MADITVNSTSEEGYVTTSRLGEFELTIDATEQEGPEPNQTLVADYASCYIPAFRVAGQQNDYDDLGKIEIDAEADIDDDDDLTAISFDIARRGRHQRRRGHARRDRRGDCHVHSALREELHADISVEGDAFDIHTSTFSASGASEVAPLLEKPGLKRPLTRSARSRYNLGGHRLRNRTAPPPPKPSRASALALHPPGTTPLPCGTAIAPPPQAAAAAPLPRRSGRRRPTQTRSGRQPPSTARFWPLR